MIGDRSTLETPCLSFSMFSSSQKDQSYRPISQVPIFDNNSCWKPPFMDICEYKKIKISCNFPTIIVKNK